MGYKKKITSLFISLIFALSLVLNNALGFTIDANATVVTTNTVVTNTIDDGAMLHAWNWSFNTIKSKLPEIAEAGYTAIQTSPIQGNKEDLMASSKWWILYQPINFKIGNAQLGTREEFKSMCAEAEKYGIKIIVDVVANHTGNRGGGSDSYYPATNVDSEIKDNPNFWHEHRGVEDWNNRWQVTQWGIGLPDLNTSNWDLQNMIIDFLNDAIACGADGFRFDAAKHIELPNDPAGSDFWPRVLGSLNNKDELFIYGEVLQGGADNITGYHDYMATTVDYYGGSVRSAVGYHNNGNINVNNAVNYTVSGSPSNFVTWVESHDTYANDNKETVGLSNEEIKLGWAIITGRAQSTPLFFNRTAGGYLAGNMGSSGDDMWKDPIVVAANKFRNAMAGQSEYVRTQGNNLFITERGTSGVMIVNAGEADYVNCNTNLPSGQYVDSVSGNTFTVSNGKLTGNIGRKTIATIVLSNVEVEPEVSSSAADGTKFTDSISITLSAKNTTNANYSIDGKAAVSYTNGTTITLGMDNVVGDKVTLKLTGSNEEGKTVAKEYVYEKVEKVDNSVAKIKLPTGWSSANIYVYDESASTTKEVAKWPGVAMTNEGNGIYSYTLPEGWDENTQVIFNNGSSQIPGAKEPGLYIAPGEIRIYEDGNWSLEESSGGGEVVTGTSTAKIKLPSGWSSANIYVYDESGSTTKEIAKWPGIAMISEGNGIYSYTIPEGWGENTQVIFNSGSLQIPGAKEPGLYIAPGETRIYESGNWNLVDSVDSISINSFTTDKSSPQTANTQITLTADAQGGSGTLNYEFTVKNSNDSSSKILQSSVSNTTTWTPTIAGKYDLTVKVTDNNGNAEIKTISFTIEARATEITINSFESDKEVAKVSEVVTLTAKAEGGLGNLSYRFYYKKDGKVITIKDFSSESNVQWQAIENGYYDIFVDVRDSSGTVKTASVNIAIKEDVEIESFDINKVSADVGEEVKLTAFATGGLGDLTYKFYYKLGDEYFDINDFSTESEVIWTPQQEGYYRLYVEVKDETGDSSMTVIKFIVGEVEELTVNLKASESSIVIDEAIKLTANATGGLGNIDYKFYYMKNGVYTKIHDYSSENTVEWTPISAGEYTVYVAAKDERGKITTESIKIMVSEAIEIEEIVLSKTNIKVGETVDITTIANGGSSLSYRVYVHDFDNNWLMLHDFAGNNSTSWTPLVADKYVIWVDVIDETGMFASKSIEVIVTE